MAILTPLEVYLQKAGVWYDIGLSGATEFYIDGDGTTALYNPGGGSPIPPAGWNRVKAMYAAYYTPAIPGGAPATTDWFKVFDIRAPVNTPVINSIVRSDTTLSNILAPFYFNVDWSGSPGSDPDDMMGIFWWQNGTLILSETVSPAANSRSSPVVYYHGDSYAVDMFYYNPGSGAGGPLASSGTLIY